MKSKVRPQKGWMWLTLLPLYIFTLLFVLGPLVYMVVLSFLTREEVWGGPAGLYPGELRQHF